ncbi:MAG: AMP-binding protein [Candidatus Omnitrophota bacterium]
MEESNIAISGLFAEAASNFPDKTALQIKYDNSWSRVTYRELEARSLKVAAFLLGEGLKRNDSVAIILENRPEWAVIYLGIIYAGLTCVPLDVQLGQAEIKNLIADSGAKVIFCSYDIFFRKAGEGTHGLPVKAVILDMPKVWGGNHVRFSDIESAPDDKTPMPDILAQDIASLIYTSGTTGEPKGVLLSHANICSNYRSIAKLRICDHSDNVLSILPLHHTYSFMVTLIVPLLLGATVTYCPSLKSQEMVRVIRGAGVTVLVGVPQFFLMLHKAISEGLKRTHSLLLPFALLYTRTRVQREWGGQLRLFVSGGAKLDPKAAIELSRFTGIKITQGYGLTETSPVVTLNPLNKIKYGSAGKPIPDVEIKVDHPGQGGVGEVLIRGPNVMQGYFKHPEWTKTVIKEGWFYSGDLGYIDSEGYLFLVGREKEVIVLSSGKNIYPEEIEHHYGRSPYIKEICVISRAEERAGGPVDTLHAVVVPDLGYFKEKNEANIRMRVRWELENLSKNLPSYKRIMGFTITREELPRTPLKKIRRHLVAERYLSLSSREPAVIKDNLSYEDDPQIPRKEIAGKVINYLSAQLKKPVYPDSHLEIDLGIDSLTKVELGLGLENALSIKIPEELFYGVSTVKELILVVSGLCGESPVLMGESDAGRMEWSKVLSPGKEEIFKDIRTEPYLRDKLITWIFKGIFIFIFRTCWLLRIKGRRNLPSEGPYLLCPNHASYLGAFIVFTGLPAGNAIDTFFLGYSDILCHPLIRPTTRAARLIPLDPNTNLIKALQAVSFVLTKKKIVCIFPEGRRSVDENIAEFKKGVGILVKELNIPVVPVYIKGSHKSWPRDKRFPRLYPLKVIFGRPLSYGELLKKRDDADDDYETIAMNLREEVLRLAC